MNTNKKVINYALKHPETFIALVSLKYNFSKDQLEKFKDILDWKKVSANTEISWDKDIMDKHVHLLHWDILSANTAAFTDFNLVSDFQDSIRWKGSTYAAFDCISDNSGIRWTEERIKKFAFKLCFEKLSTNSNIEWSEKLLDLYRHQWDWEELIANRSFPWTPELFDKYLDTSYLRLTGARNNFSLLNYSFVEKYSDMLDWHSISMNPLLPWEEKKLLELWSEKLVWTGLAGNTHLFENDKNFFQKHFDIWFQNKALYFTYFSSNEAFDWSTERMEYYKDVIDWDLLSSNEGIKWDENLIDQFGDKIFWGGWVPLINMAPDGTTVRQKNKYMFESGLINNRSIKWTIEMLQKYEESIDTRALVSHSSAWENSFSPYVDNETVETIFRIL